MKKGVIANTVLLLGMTTLLLVGCGGGGGGSVEVRGETARVRIILAGPEAARSLGFSQAPGQIPHALFLDQSQELAQIPEAVASIRITVTGPGIDPPIRTTVSRPFPDEIALSILAGTNREFMAEALNAGNAVIFQGVTTGVTLIAGQEVSVEIMLAAILEVRTPVARQPVTAATGGTVETTVPGVPGRLVIAIPAGALPASRTLAINVVDNPETPLPGALGPVVEIVLDVPTTFTTPITLEFPFSEEALAQRFVPEESARLFRLNEATRIWEAVPNQKVDTTRNVIIASLTSLSRFAVGQITPPRILRIELVDRPQDQALILVSRDEAGNLVRRAQPALRNLTPLFQVVFSKPMDPALLTTLDRFGQTTADGLVLTILEEETGICITSGTASAALAQQPGCTAQILALKAGDFFFLSLSTDRTTLLLDTRPQSQTPRDLGRGPTDFAPFSYDVRLDFGANVVKDGVPGEGLGVDPLTNRLTAANSAKFRTSSESRPCKDDPGAAICK